jgi:hypothetical protein
MDFKQFNHSNKMCTTYKIKITGRKRKRGGKTQAAKENEHSNGMHTLERVIM